MALRMGSAVWVLVFFSLALWKCSANQDPALCPYELGYSPSFNSDGSQLFCNKGNETFAVWANLTNVIALRDIGNSVRGLTMGAMQYSRDLFYEYTVVDEIQIVLPNGTITQHDDPTFAQFLFSFRFQPGQDVNGAFAVSKFRYIGGSPALAKVNWWIFTLDFTIVFNTTFRLNNVGNGTMTWQQVYIVSHYR